MPVDKLSINAIKKLLTDSINKNSAAPCQAAYTQMTASKNYPDIAELGRNCLLVMKSEKDWFISRCHLQIAIVLQDLNLQQSCITSLNKLNYDYNQSYPFNFKPPLYHALEQYNQPLVYLLLRQKAFPDDGDFFI